MIELASEISNAASLKVEIVHVDIKTLLVAYIKLFLGILQQECCLSNAPRTLNTNHAVRPVDLIHKTATNWCVHMLYQVTMRSEKSFHLQIRFKTAAKVRLFCEIAKPR
jgi:hypothetical protein